MDHKEKCKDKNGIYNNNYIIDASLGNDKATIREAKFTFDVEQDGSVWDESEWDPTDVYLLVYNLR